MIPVTKPFEFTVTTGIEDADPNVPGTPDEVLTVANVSGKAPLATVPVASPVAERDREMLTVSGPDNIVRLTPFDPVKFVLRYPYTSALIV